jgi:YfiH family protein
VAHPPELEGFLLEEQPGGWLVGRFPALSALSGIVHAVTTRRGPAFGPHAESPQTAAAVAELGLRLGLRETAWCHQVHGSEVLNVVAGGLAGNGDALVTDEGGVGILCRSADCPLVLVTAPGVGAVGVAHASWRATIRGVTARLIQELAGRFGASPALMTACISPSAGPCCYEVGPEVLEAAVEGLGEHARAFFTQRRDRTLFDLWRANADQLRRGGLSPGRIHVAGICTIHRSDLFPSYRADRAESGRFAAVIALVPGQEGPGEEIA